MTAVGHTGHFALLAAPPAIIRGSRGDIPRRLACHGCLLGPGCRLMTSHRNIFRRIRQPPENRITGLAADGHDDAVAYRVGRWLRDDVTGLQDIRHRFVRADCKKEMIKSPQEAAQSRAASHFFSHGVSTPRNEGTYGRIRTGARVRPHRQAGSGTCRNDDDVDVVITGSYCA